MCISNFLAKLPVIKNFFDYKAVPVIRLSGILSDGQSRKASISYDRYNKLIEKAFDIAGADEDNKTCVVLIINSPGGSPAQSELIANQIRRLADTKQVPVYAFVEDVAASGGYWLACAADNIYTAKTSIVGSIGVIAAMFGFQDIIKQHGIERRVYTSGENKSFLDPFLPAQKKDIERIKSMQSDIHDHFKKWVKDRRGVRIEGRDDDLFEGQFWSGQEALELGIIDGIDDYQNFILEKFGDKAVLIDLHPEKKWFSLPGLIGSRTVIPTDIVGNVIDNVEERARWQQFGL